MPNFKHKKYSLVQPIFKKMPHGVAKYAIYTEKFAGIFSVIFFEAKRILQNQNSVSDRKIGWRFGPGEGMEAVKSEDLDTLS